MGSMENVHSSASDSLIWGFSIISIVMTKLIFHVYMVEIVDQEEARILLQWHVLYKAYVEEEAKLKVGAAANQQEKQTKEEVGLEVSVTPSGSTMYVASIISVDLATSTNMRFLTLVLETKKMASAASSLSAKERREQAAAARGTTLSNSRSSEKSQLGSMGKTGQIFTPHIVNIASGEVMILTKTDYFHDLAQSEIFSFPFFKLRLFARRFKLKEFSDAESCQIDLAL